MVEMKEKLKNLLVDEGGQAMVEYIMVAIALIAAFSGVNALFEGALNRYWGKFSGGSSAGLAPPFGVRL